MLLHLIRYAYTPDETLGCLKFPIVEDSELSKYALWTVESPWQNNTPFQSCIPDGGYTLQAFDSTRHPDSWIITPVEGRNGILLHPGNDCSDVQGCIAPGLTRSGVKVWNSADAMRMLGYVLSRNEQHQILIGSGLGAIMPDRDTQTADMFTDSKPDDGLPDDSDRDNRDRPSVHEVQRPQPEGRR